jgi:hypothetical protein
MATEKKNDKKSSDRSNTSTRQENHEGKRTNKGEKDSRSDQARKESEMNMKRVDIPDKHRSDLGKNVDLESHLEKQVIQPHKYRWNDKTFRDVSERA